MTMPEKDVIEHARRDAEEGKSPSTQAAEFVREEIEHVRQGKHGDHRDWFVGSPRGTQPRM
jgi:hypothetical protein